MDETKIVDELIDAGFQGLESDDPVAFMEWRRRVAALLGPNHVYTQLFQGPVDKKSKDVLTGGSIPNGATDQVVAPNKRVA